MTADAALRATLFGDVPLDRWPAGDEEAGAPWDSFVRARQHLADGDQDLAVREWAAIETLAGFGAVESRHVLQAWGCLRSVGVQPDASIADDVLGVVVEVAVDDQHDVLAAYADGSVRYLNHGGSSTIVDLGPGGAGPPDVVQHAAALIGAGQLLFAQIGPWTEPSLPPLPVAHTRITLLSRGGPRFGQGPDEILQGDAMARPVLAAATELLVAVVALPS